MGLFGGIANVFAQGAGAADPGDQTANYNTPLSPAEEAAFQQWAARSGKTKDLYDYDLRGAWKHNAQAAGNGHLPDNWKKPNHPTFSDQSIYHGPYTPGGTWTQLPGGKWQFSASPQNLKYQDAGDLQNYFASVEKGNRLVLPKDDTIGGLLSTLNIFGNPPK